jgi:hypothetical protein
VGAFLFCTTPPSVKPQARPLDGIPRYLKTPARAMWVYQFGYLNELGYPVSTNYALANYAALVIGRCGSIHSGFGSTPGMHPPGRASLTLASRPEGTSR